MATRRAEQPAAAKNCSASFLKSRGKLTEGVKIELAEIDAHMHPQWQRILLNRIREIFPNVQLLATTHSPLVIAGLPWDRVFHVVRSRDEDTKVDWTGGGAAG